MQVGIDLVYLPNFKKRIDNVSPEKVFNETEMQQNSSLESLAGIFAAKEAFMKALGRKIGWQEVWVEKLATGQPVLKSDLLTAQQKSSVSISHDGDYAIAIVILKETRTQETRNK